MIYGVEYNYGVVCYASVVAAVSVPNYCPFSRAMYCKVPFSVVQGTEGVFGRVAEIGAVDNYASRGAAGDAHGGSYY